MIGYNLIKGRKTMSNLKIYAYHEDIEGAMEVDELSFCQGHVRVTRSLPIEYCLECQNRSDYKECCHPYLKLDDSVTLEIKVSVR